METGHVEAFVRKLGWEAGQQLKGEVGGTEWHWLEGSLREAEAAGAA